MWSFGAAGKYVYVFNIPPFYVFSTELLDDVLREKPQEADGIDSVVVVDNVPQVGPERLEKLKNVIHKIFSKFGKITTEFYPEADGATKGYGLCFPAQLQLSSVRDVFTVLRTSSAGTSFWSTPPPPRLWRL